MPYINLTREEMCRCWDFCLTSAENQQKIEFGQHDTVPRRIGEIARDNFIGKLAELAFQKYMADQYNIIVNLDFNYYPRGIWDDQDALINGYAVDIKATRSGSRWFLIELNKLKFRGEQNRLPDYFVGAVVEWNRKTNKASGRVDLKGYGELALFKEGVEGTIFLSKGECIPGTGTLLQADNYARKLEDLNTNWEKFAETLRRGRENRDM